MATKVTGVQTLTAQQREALEKELYQPSTSPFAEGAVLTISSFTPEINTWKDSRTGVLNSKKIFILHLKAIENEISSTFITGGRRGWVQDESNQWQLQLVPRMGTMNVAIRSFLESHAGLTMGEIAKALTETFKDCTFRCNYNSIITDPQSPYNATSRASLLEFNWEKAPVETKEKPAKKNPTKKLGSSSLDRQPRLDPPELPVLILTGSQY